MRNLPQISRLLKVVIVFGLVGCEAKSQKTKRTDESNEKQVTKKSGEPTDLGGFKVGKITLAPSQAIFQAENLPDDKKMKACIETELKKHTPFDGAGNRVVDGTITYDYKSTGTVFEVALFGILAETKKSDPVSADIGTRLKSNDLLVAGKAAPDIAQTVCERFAEKVALMFRVASASDEDLVKIAEDEKTDPEALVRAIQEIREREYKAGVPILVQHLAHRNSRVAVAAAAGVSRLDPQKGRADVIKLAERLSRERDPQYVPLLHIVADIGGAEARTYLETVAESHDADGVRRIAADALKHVK